MADVMIRGAVVNALANLLNTAYDSEAPSTAESDRLKAVAAAGREEYDWMRRRITVLERQVLDAQELYSNLLREHDAWVSIARRVELDRDELSRKLGWFVLIADFIFGDACRVHDGAFDPHCICCVTFVEQTRHYLKKLKSGEKAGAHHELHEEIEEALSARVQQ